LYFKLRERVHKNVVSVRFTSEMLDKIAELARQSNMSRNMLIKSVVRIMLMQNSPLKQAKLRNNRASPRIVFYSRAVFCEAVWSLIERLYYSMSFLNITQSNIIIRNHLTPFLTRDILCRVRFYH
jgi:hypothetical protein